MYGLNLFSLLLISSLFANVFDGYTLYTSEPNYTTYLIDNDLNVINEWYADCQPASMAYLQPDSTLTVSYTHLTLPTILRV